MEIFIVAINLLYIIFFCAVTKGDIALFCESFSESFTTRLHCKGPNPDSMETCVDKNVEMIENPLSKHIGSDLNRKQSVEAYLQKNLSKRKTKMMV